MPKKNIEFKTNAFVGGEIAIDMGTATTTILVNGKGIVMKEPSLIAVDLNDQIVAVGKDARDMFGRNPLNIKILSPIQNAVVADVELASAMLKLFLKKRLKMTNFSKSKMLFSFPVGATEVEKSALYDVGISAGAKEVNLVSSSVAAILGTGVSIKIPRAQMIINMGCGHIEAAVCSFGEVLAGGFERTGGRGIDEAILRYMKFKHRLQISMATAENIKIKLASVYPVGDDYNDFMEVRGRNLSDNLPRSVTVNAEELRTCICESTAPVLRIISKTCENLSPQIAGDILEGEVVMCGGSSQLVGLKEYIKDTIGLDLILADNPYDLVITGMGNILSGKDIKVQN